MPRHACDGLFVTTSGVGVIRPEHTISIAAGQPGDVVLVNGTLGDHGAAILCARGDLALQTHLQSDCAPLNTLVDTLLRAVPGVHCMRDATRGGVAGVLSELVEASNVLVTVNEAALPVHPEVKGCVKFWGWTRCFWPMRANWWPLFPHAMRSTHLPPCKATRWGAMLPLLARCKPVPAGRGLFMLLMSLVVHGF